MISKEFIDERMASGATYKITFTKGDGTQRVFEDATLDMTKVPEKFQPKGTSTRAPNPNAKSVWVVSEGAWKSFRYDSVLQFEGVKDEG